MPVAKDASSCRAGAEISPSLAWVEVDLDVRAIYHEVMHNDKSSVASFKFFYLAHNYEDAYVTKFQELRCFHVGRTYHYIVHRSVRENPTTRRPLEGQSSRDFDDT